MKEPLTKLQEIVPKICALFLEDKDKDFSCPDKDMYYYEYYHYEKDGFYVRFGVNYRAIKTEDGRHLPIKAYVDEDEIDARYETSEFWVEYTIPALHELAKRMTDFINYKIQPHGC